MIYLDNAATTPMHPEVIETMISHMGKVYGNPSSTHALGRKSRNLIETARKSIASHFKVSAGEIIFTSSGTEADNLIIFNAVKNLGVSRIISSKIEHHAVLHTVEAMVNGGKVHLDYVNLTDKGQIDVQDLRALLGDSDEKTLVSLMYINNEIGNKLPLQEVAELCKEFGALFHSDTVQAIGHYPIDLSITPVDFIVGSAHKFHGPKGVGFAFFRKGIGITPMMHGGNQEKGARSSTEAVHGIAAMSKALNLSLINIYEDIDYLNDLKSYCISSLKDLDLNIEFNGLSGISQDSSCTILSIRLPKDYPMLLFQLDLAGIALSGGSACQSGSNEGSHVLKQVNGIEDQRTSIRVSFSKFTTKGDIDLFVKKIKELL